MRLSLLGLAVMLAATATFAAQAVKKTNQARPAARQADTDAGDEDQAPAKKSADEADEPSDDDDDGQPAKKPAAGKSTKKAFGLKVADTDDAELEEKFSYMQGYQLGQVLAQQLQQVDLKLDRKRFDQALTDALGRKEPGMSEDDMRGAIEEIQKRVQRRQVAAAAKNKKDGEVFLAANKKKEGVTTLPGGLQYKVLKSGKGKSPKATDTALVDYKGTFLDGSEFDNSYTRGEPTIIQLERVIPGWKQALPQMKVGDKWQLFVPSSLAYGEQGMRDQRGNEVIPPNSLLQFEIELLEVNPKLTKPGPR